MIQDKILILSIEKSGGLFDFDGTLPIIAIQFLILTFLLNIILYTPLLQIINKRNQYINKNLSQALLQLSDAENLSKQYEMELVKAKKEAQLEISKVQKLHKNLLENEIKISKKNFDRYLAQITNTLTLEKSKILKNLEEDIDSFSNEIIIRITK